jgi:hypothetical protein
VTASGSREIRQHPVERFSEPKHAIYLPQQQHPAVAADVSTLEVRLDFAAIKAWKIQKFLLTFWH